MLPVFPLSRVALTVLAGSLLLASGSHSGEDVKKPGGDVILKEVPLKQVLADIALHKDKVVLIDIWGEFCLPCKMEFPHLVRLHQIHAKDGLVCMSIAVDEVENKDRALAFLKKEKAAFANYLLSADSENWQDHWDINAVPAVLVYRGGKLDRKFTRDNPDNQYTYAEVEKYVAQLLKDRKK